MDLLFLTPSLSSTSHDVQLCKGLSKALASMDHQVTLIAPYDPKVNLQGLALAKRLQSIEVTGSDQEEPITFNMYDGRSAAGVKIVLLGQQGDSPWVPPHDNPQAWHDAEAMHRRHAKQWLKALEQFIKEAAPPFDLVHAVSWLGILGLAELQLPQSIYKVLTLGSDSSGIHQRDATETLKQAIGHADHISFCNTAPASLVEAIPELQSAGISAIGVDNSTWNPATDTHLPYRFDAMDLHGKAMCKSWFQNQQELPLSPHALITLICDSNQIADMLPALSIALEQAMQLAVIITHGELTEEQASALDELRNRWPERFAWHTANTEDELHAPIAASDYTALLTEQSTLLPACLQSYGTFPIITQAHPLQHSVVDCDAEMRSGNGLCIQALEQEALVHGIQRALTLFAQSPNFRALRRHMMQVDHSWNRSAHLHESIYVSLDDSSHAA